MALDLTPSARPHGAQRMFSMTILVVEVFLVFFAALVAHQLIPEDRVLLATGTHLAAETKRALPHLDERRILAEPQAKNTAPCIAWATEVVLAEVAALFAGYDQPGVPFFDNSGDTPCFRRIV